MFQIIFFLIFVGCIKLELTSEYSQNKVMESIFEDQKTEQELQKTESNEMFFLQIADQIEGRLFYNFLNYHNLDVQSKRIIYASVLSIILLFIFCLILNYIDQKSKYSKILLNMENNHIPAINQNV